MENTDIVKKKNFFLICDGDHFNLTCFETCKVSLWVVMLSFAVVISLSFFSETYKHLWTAHRHKVQYHVPYVTEKYF